MPEHKSDTLLFHVNPSSTHSKIKLGWVRGTGAKKKIIKIKIVRFLKKNLSSGCVTRRRLVMICDFLPLSGVKKKKSFSSPSVEKRGLASEIKCSARKSARESRKARLCYINGANNLNSENQILVSKSKKRRTKR